MESAPTEELAIHGIYLNTDDIGIFFYETLTAEHDGMFILSDGTAPDLFLRGDANGDGAVGGLSDGFFVLAYQFIPGSPAPPCSGSAP